MKSILHPALAAALIATPGFAAERYALDPSHSQVLFSYNHLGFSTTFGMFSGWQGEIVFDEADPSASSVTVSIPVKAMFTGWEQRDGHFLSDDFFGATDEDLVTFTSTAIEVTGDDTAMITGDLTMNEMTKSIVLDAKLNQAANHPMMQKPFLGFDATTTILRSDFGVGQFAPNISDEVEIQISIEAAQAEAS
ncbi:MAG: YceI family protein [Pseudomonadota bacterium]